MILYRSGWLKRAEVWFDETLSDVRVDIIRYSQATAPISGAACTPFWTLVIDLSKSEEELWNNLRKETRYEIRRAKEKK